MNKEQMTQEQRAQLIEKLHTEYNDLNGKIARLNAFLCDIDFVKKVPDPIEQSLMSMQLRKDTSIICGRASFSRRGSC